MMTSQRKVMNRARNTLDQEFGSPGEVPDSAPDEVFDLYVAVDQMLAWVAGGMRRKGLTARARSWILAEFADIERKNLTDFATPAQSRELENFKRIVQATAVVSDRHGPEA